MTNEFSVSLSGNRATVVNSGIHVASGDKGVVFKITLTGIDITGTTGAKIVFFRSNGTSVEADVTEASGVFSYTTLGNEFAVPGKTLCDIKLYVGQTQRSSSQAFCFEVMSDTMDGLGEGTGGYSDRLEQLVNECELTEAELEVLTGRTNNLIEDIQTALIGGTYKPRGDYSASTDYLPLDVVIYNGDSYVCVLTCTNKVPTNTTYWQRMTALSECNAASATKLQTPRNINGVAFDGSEDINTPSKYETESQETILSASGWYRIGKFNIIHHANAMIYVCTRYNNNANCAFNIALSSAYETASFTQLSASLNNPNGTPTVSKVRFVHKPNSECYIEIYYSVNNANMVYAKLSCMQQITNVAFTTGEIPEGYTATEFELSASPVKANVIEGDLIGTASGNLPFKGVIPANTNLDDLTIGIWETGNYARKGTLTNLPADILGTVIVYPGFGGDNLKRHQEFIGMYTESSIYHRFMNSSDAWSAWTKMLNTGNSSPVVISATAPSDTSSLWIDNVNMVQKIYKNGAWTALS